jgi:hypothetical protein
MARFGKKTLYLDLDALDKMQAALDRLPGRTSISSYLNENLPLLAELLESQVQAVTGGGLRGLAQMMQDLGGTLQTIDEESRAILAEPEKPVLEVKKLIKPARTVRKVVPPKEESVIVPPAKSRKAKKAV